jgi:pSer/pThr/pTyr-binding forkhead associated (FHA) protein
MPEAMRNPAGARHSLEVVAGPARGSRITLSEATLSIGREESGEGRLGDDPELSRRHARIQVLPERGLLIEDLESRNGTYVNGVRIPAPTLLRAGDEISLGGTTLRVVAEPAPAPVAETPPPPARRSALLVVAGWAPGALIPIGQEPVVIGRTATGSAALEGDPAVAEQHARLSTLADGRVLLEDLGSGSGTLVEGRPIPAPTVLALGQRFQIGGSTLEVVHAAAEPRESVGDAGRELGGVRQLPEGLFTLIGLRAPVSRDQVVRVFAIAVALGLAVNLGIREAAIHLTRVRADLSALRLVPLLMATALPIAANALGFYKIFRRPDHQSLKRYLAPTIGVPTVLFAINVARLNHRGPLDVVVAALVIMLPIGICATLMLTLRVRVARGRVAAVRGTAPAVDRRTSGD